MKSTYEVDEVRKMTSVLKTFFSKQASLSLSCQPQGHSPDAAAHVEDQESQTSASDKPQTQEEGQSRAHTPKNPPTQRSPATCYHNEGIKEINPSEIGRSEKSSSCGTCGMCYLAHSCEIFVVSD